MKVAVFSDLHLRGPDDPLQRRFVAWLGREPVDRLVLLGDVFEAWWHFGATPLPAYTDVVAALRRHTVTFVPGNHDFHAGAFFREQLGATVVDELHDTWDGLRVVALHGDHVDRSAGYRALTAVLRGRAFAAVVDAMGPARAWRFLLRLAGTPGGRPNPTLVAAQLRDAEARLAAADLVLMGHSHAPGVHRFGAGTYVNVGDCAEPAPYLVVEAGVPRVEQL